MDPFATTRPALRLGAVPWTAAAPLLGGFGPECAFDTPDALARRLQDGELDAALIPPLAAWAAGPVRLVPGIALCLVSGLTAPGLVWDDPQLAQALGLPETQDLGALHAAWARESALPLVLLVWACRHRAPYPEIRRALTHARRETEATLQPMPFTLGLGADESDALRLLLTHAKARQLAPQDSDVVYC
jgi:predicted solute-binding protein